MRKNDQLVAVETELKRLKIPYHVEHTGGNHLKVCWEVTRKRIYFLSRTPSDWRGVKNARATVRKMLKEDGVVGA